MSEKNNPKAFPLEGVGQYGMTLRDYFAAKALPECMKLEHTRADEVASWAYEVADAMLRAREAK